MLATNYRSYLKKLYNDRPLYRWSGSGDGVRKTVTGLGRGQQWQGRCRGGGQRRWRGRDKTTMAAGTVVARPD